MDSLGAGFRSSLDKGSNSNHPGQKNRRFRESLSMDISIGLKDFKISFDNDLGFWVCLFIPDSLRDFRIRNLQSRSLEKFPTLIQTVSVITVHGTVTSHFAMVTVLFLFIISQKPSSKKILSKLGAKHIDKLPNWRVVSLQTTGQKIDSFEKISSRSSRLEGRFQTTRKLKQYLTPQALKLN